MRQRLLAWRRMIVIGVVILTMSATLLANYMLQFGIDGNNNPSNGYLGMWTTGTVNSDPDFYGYPSGPTYIKVRIDGIGNGYCTAGWNDGGWCADNAHGSYWTGWTSHAMQHIDMVPIGCYTATTMVWVGGYLRENYPVGQCFPDPPPDPEQECANQGAGWQWINGECTYSSPIVISTGRSQAYRFTRTENGVYFDLNADGRAELVAWTEADSEVAFLALDRNGNGLIDDGSELFGDSTFKGVAGNGFHALRLQAGVNQGSVNASVPVFAQLLLWTDRNHDGVSQADELAPASSVLEAIGLGYTTSFRKDAENEFRYQGWARRLGGNANDVASREFKIYDVFLSVR